MSWHAKPSGGYTISSVEGNDNIHMINNMLLSAGYSRPARASVLSNCYNESALNPWRWQNDQLVTSAGYGLFQFTPASDYLISCSSLPYFAPNMSTSFQTAGAMETDAICQVNVLTTDYLSKWVSTCWRSYWSNDQQLQALRYEILTTYGNGTSITQQQFSRIYGNTQHVIDMALFAFFACYEGPANVSDYYGRRQAAYEIYQIIGDSPTPSRSKMPIWMMCRPPWKK